ncbi:winged helix-turn-helix domain-containing protein [Brevundimonas sp.]|uniref:winged helix-turn-helix domain-containing protein n=1 Tax=Brevundimonas sp. TaxID=1871086 RepID=UPI002D4FAAD8|nr:winged helix-turn-helix domain-containing protein [Brevundimonas sp.]HYC96864.1 winged helix-turn-helix domain-containing protein [Brevundimonas sp.]
MIVGEWTVDPVRGQLTGNGRAVQLEPRAMRLLLCLAERPGELVSIDDLLTNVWPEVIVGSDSVYQAVASLRRRLGDDARQPRYIATESRLGYRLVAHVARAPAVAANSDRSKASPRGVAVASVALAVLLILATAWVSGGLPWTRSHPPIPSVAVLPFIDMTDTMDQEVLVDDTTEGVIAALAGLPGIQTTGLRSTFQFKGQRISPEAAAAQLGVDFVVDGRLRKEGARVNVFTQLVRGKDGFVVWSHVFEAPLGNAPGLHSEIAAALANQLTAEVGQGHELAESGSRERMGPRAFGLTPRLADRSRRA